MKNTLCAVSIVLASAGFAAVAGSKMGGHIMATPGDLKWEDVRSLPPGATIAGMEGPMNTAVPFTARLKLPANYKNAANWHPGVEGGYRTFRHFQL